MKKINPVSNLLNKIKLPSSPQAHILYTQIQLFFMKTAF